jgi:glutamate-ammonia-ligase adenylyltransferase
MTRTQLQEAVEACRNADEARLAEILDGLGYLQPRRSATNLVLLAENPDLAGLLDLIIVDALESASPDDTLNSLERLANTAESEDLLAVISAPEMRRRLFVILGASPFLAGLLPR